MASLNLSSVLLDPDLGKSFATKYEVREQHAFSSSIWGASNVRTLDDLELELANEEIKEIDDEMDVRDDLSDEEND